METRGGLTPLPFKTASEVGCAIRDDRYQSSGDVPESANMVSTDGEGEVEQENLQMVDSNEGTAIIYSSPTDPSFTDDYTINSELGNYLSRPVLIKTSLWSLGTPFTETFAPWDLFFNDTRIKKKLDNYSLLNCTLNVKFVINASPFYYGLCIASYRPMIGFKDETIINVSSYDDDLVPLSQRPHVYIYPQENKGGMLKLPFFYHKNWLRVNDRQSFQWMGEINLREMISLQNANSVVGTDVTIQTYAWASDIKLTGPTNALALQSSDEYMYTGPVSAPASAIATISGKLEEVPVIGPFMTATRALSSGVAQFASYFGFTNTQVIDDVKPFKDLPFHSFASSEIGQPTEKLTLDPKNELSIDPRIVGLDGHDELSIRSFVERESYLDNETWAASDGVDTVLFTSRVLPTLNRVDGIYRQVTPMAYASMLFKYWRGDIIYRVRFICSKYHRGRARITWDPEGDIVTDAVTSTTSFTRIVDISQETDIEIRIPYMQSTPWLKTSTNLDDEWFGKGEPYFRDASSDNGHFCIRVFTEQSSPIASADIQVVVSVKGSDNLEFAAPRELSSDLTFWEPQSSDEMLYDGNNLVNITQNVEGKKHPQRYLINMGEKITSFRQLLRRASLSRRFSTADVDNTNNYSSIISRMSPYPLYNGFDTNGINIADSVVTPGTDKAYNFCYNIPFNWLGNCFVGMRGSSTWHLNCDSVVPSATLRWFRDDQPRSAAEYAIVTNWVNFPNEQQLQRAFIIESDSGASGQSLTNPITQSGSSVTVPMYSYMRMMSTDPVKRVLGNSIDNSDVESVSFETLVKGDNTTGSKTQVYSLYHNIGTDFSFFFFLNCPTVIKSLVPLGKQTP